SFARKMGKAGRGASVCNANAYTSKAMEQDSSGRTIRMNPNTPAQFPEASSCRCPERPDERPTGSARAAMVGNAPESIALRFADAASHAPKSRWFLARNNRSPPLPVVAGPSDPPAKRFGLCAAAHDKAE